MPRRTLILELPTLTGDPAHDLAAAKAHEAKLLRAADRSPPEEAGSILEALAAARARVEETLLAVEVAELEARLRQPLGPDFWRGLSIDEIDLAWELRPEDLCALAKSQPDAIRLPSRPELVRALDGVAAIWLLSVLGRAGGGEVMSAVAAIAGGALRSDQALVVRVEPALAVAGGEVVPVHGPLPSWGTVLQLGERAGWIVSGGALRRITADLADALARLRAAEPGSTRIDRGDLGALGVHPEKGYLRLVWHAGSRRVELPLWGATLEARARDLLAVHAAGLGDLIPEAALWLPATLCPTKDGGRYRLTDTTLGRRTGYPPAAIWAHKVRQAPGGTADLSRPLDDANVTVVDSVLGPGRGGAVERTAVAVVQLPGVVRLGSGASFELLHERPQVRGVDAGGHLRDQVVLERAPGRLGESFRDREKVVGQRGSVVRRRRGSDGAAVVAE